MVIAVASILYSAVKIVIEPPASLTFVVVTVLSVVVAGTLWLQIGTLPELPLVGVTVIVLAVHKSDTPALTAVGIWGVGMLITQLILYRRVGFALYSVGVGIVAALVFVAAADWTTATGIPGIIGFLIASVGYYFVTLLIEFVRARGRWSRDRHVGLSSLSPLRIGMIVVLVAVMSTLIVFIDRQVIPWLEQDPTASRTPVVVLTFAVGFAALSQHLRNRGTERRLKGVVDAAVSLPWDQDRGLDEALLERTTAIVHASEVEIRPYPPENDEIGAAVALSDGVDKYLVASRKLGSAPFTREDQRVLRALSHMASETARINRNLDNLEKRANSDPLTGLPNYGAFQDALTEANNNRFYHEGIAVLFLDLDNFKRLNDTRGHHAGDELLKEVANRLLDAVASGNVVSRIGGDEFVVIMTGLQSMAEAKESADRLVDAVGQPLLIDGIDTRPVVSAGLAFSSHREIDPQLLVVDADRSMLQVKRSRRQGGPSEGSSVSIASHRSTRTNDIIARAIQENRLSLAFQPIVSIDQGKIWAFEALVRYVDPELGPISPSSLVARAKSLGLMNELTRQVITKAMDAADMFHAREPGIACMTVNLELGQIADHELGPFIRQTAKDHPAVSLCIELNERSLRSVTDDLRREAEIMQDAGVIIALDDYGSDDSSVGALVRFPMDILKIDRSLVDDLKDVRQREVIKALQGFGDNLDYTMVVEGIEDPEMVGVMIELGVKSAQGYYYGRPMAFKQTMDRLIYWGTRAVIDPAAVR